MGAESPTIDIVADNWLLQEAVHAVVRSEEAGDDAAWFDLSRHEPVVRTGSSTAASVMSLLATLEQVVLADTIRVLPTFMNTWLEEDQALDSLHKDGAILPLGGTVEQRRPLTERYLKHIRAHPVAAQLFAESSEDPFERNSFEAQVWWGGASYLGIAEDRELSYVPHPIRGHALHQAIYYHGWPEGPVAKVLDSIGNSRVQLSRSLNVAGDAEATAIRYRISPIPLLVLREASRREDLFEVARQLRHEHEFQRFRCDLARLRQAMSVEDLKEAQGLLKSFESAILEVERRLNLRKHNPEVDGPIHVSWKSLPVRVPTVLHSPVRTPAHTAIIQRIVETGLENLESLLSSRLGIRSRAVVADIVNGGFTAG
ncbi:MAG: hypothetical protein ACQEXJ_21410 [Myxococcota bacterium]